MRRDPRAHPEYFYEVTTPKPAKQQPQDSSLTFVDESSLRPQPAPRAAPVPQPAPLSANQPVVNKWSHCFKPPGTQQSNTTTPISMLPEERMPQPYSTESATTTSSFPAHSNYQEHETFNNGITTLQQQLQSLQQQQQILLQLLAWQTQPLLYASELNNGEVCYGGIQSTALDVPVIPEDNNEPTESLLTPAPFGCFKTPDDPIGKIVPTLCPATLFAPSSPVASPFSPSRNASMISSSFSSSMSPNIARPASP
jgi:hypothetical protein